MFYMLGNLLALGYSAALIGLLASLYLSRKQISVVLKDKVDRYSIIALVGILAFFLIVALKFVHPVEQLYFDENIYQGIGINILRHFDATWCQYGTGYLSSCGSTLIYHDPAEFSFFLAIAFGLFGIGTSTSFATTLFFGFASVFLLFMLSSILFGKRVAPMATAAFAILPELYIWSRVQASPDLAFMALTTLSMFLFFVFIRSRSRPTMLAFLFSLALAIMMRTEGIILLAIFLLAYALSFKGSITGKARSLYHAAVSASYSTGTLLCLLAFFLVISPQLFFIAYQLPNPQFGQDAQHPLFALSNLARNVHDNALYLTGYYDKKSFYPASFPLSVSVMALFGIATLLLDRSIRDKWFAAAMLTMWFLAYELFYGLFYAGSAVYGVDSRFMLQVHPAIAIFSGLGLYGIASFASFMVQKAMRIRKGTAKGILFAAICVAVSAPFLYLTMAQYWSVMTLTPQEMPQQGTIYPSLQFFYNNYDKVPNNCLVFSFTPDTWLEHNRSAAQITYVSGGDGSFSNFSRQFSCYVFDYGYWCAVPPNHDGTCASMLKDYSTRQIAYANIPSSVAKNVSLYYLLNYSR